MERFNLKQMEQFWNHVAKGLVTSEGFQTYLQSISSPSPEWTTDSNGVTNLAPLTSNGRTGSEWFELFNMMRVSISDKAGNFFNCFNPSDGRGYLISILTPSLFPPELPITTEQVLAKANVLGLSIPTERSMIGEIMFLLSTFLSFQKMNDMGLDRIGILHQNRSEHHDNEHYLLCFEVKGPDHYRSKGLAVYRSHPGNKWYGNRTGFVFLR